MQKYGILAHDMQGRWELLKAIHQNIVRNRDLGILPVKFGQITLDVLSSPVELCLKDVRCCSHCHHLLLVTCLRSLFEGDKSKDHLYLPYYAVLTEVDVLSLLKSGLMSGNKFISHESRKALVAAVQSRIFRKHETCFITELLAEIIIPDLWPVFCQLELIKDLMSRRVGYDINAHCFHILKPVWVEVFNKCWTKEIEKKDAGLDILLSVLMLVQKLAKYIKSCDKNLKTDGMETIINPVVYDLASFASLVSSNLTSRGKQIVSQKVFDVINCVFHYGELAHWKKVNAAYQKLTSVVLKGINSVSPQNEIFAEKFVGFGGTEILLKETEKNDLSMLRQFSLLCFKTWAMRLKCLDYFQTVSSSSLSEVIDSIFMLTGKILQVLPLEYGSHFRWLPLLFCDQDDSMIEALLCLLDVYVRLKKRSLTSARLKAMLNPHVLFFDFVDVICGDHSVIVDLLMSPETCFLLYFTCYLKCLISEWNIFTNSAHARYCTSVEKSDNYQKCLTQDVQGQIPNKEINVCGSDGVSFDRMPGSSKQSFSPALKPISADRSAMMVECKSSSGAGVKQCGQMQEDEGNQQHCSFNSEAAKIFLSERSESEPDKLFKVKQLIADEQEGSRTVLSSGLASIMQYENEEETDDGDIETHLEKDEKVILLPGCSCLQCVDQAMGILIRTQLRIDTLLTQGLFPYNPGPLLSLLKKCEKHYEKMAYIFPT